jgi:hypothetical protein
MGKIIIVLAFIGIAYWYWTGPYQHSAKAHPEDNPKKNAQIIAECVAQENFAKADGYRDPGENPEEICADENNLYMFDGKWYHR